MTADIKTPEVADALGVNYYRLVGLLRSRRIPAPRKDSSGDYAWSPDDVGRAAPPSAFPGRKRAPADAAAPA